MRCQATRTSLYANDHADTDKQCQCQAQYVVNGQNLCRRHAAPIALNRLVALGEIKCLTPCQVCGEHPTTTALGSGKALLRVCEVCKRAIAADLQTSQTSES